MNPQDEIDQLKQRVQDLESKIHAFMRSDRFVMTKPITSEQSRGLEILTNTNQKLIFYGGTPVVRYDGTTFNGVPGGTYGGTEAATLAGLRAALLYYNLIHD